MRFNPGTPYALTDNGVLLAGDPILQVPGSQLRLYRLGPWRLRAFQDGVFVDGWMSLDSSYNRFIGSRRGTLMLTLSRKAFCPSPGPPPGDAVVEFGAIRVNENHQPELTGKLRTFHVSVPNCRQKIVPIEVGPPPWRIQVHFAQLFRPSDYGINDGRELGAQVNYVYQPG
jgi:hypothetical protein